jgi:DNA-binding phage protein
MVRRCHDWDEDMLEDLLDPKFSGELMMGAVKSGAPLREALADIVRGIGVKEFAASIGMSSANVLRALRPTHNPSCATLDRMLEPFGLRLGFALRGPSRRRRSRAAASCSDRRRSRASG